MDQGLLGGLRLEPVNKKTLKVLGFRFLVPVKVPGKPQSLFHCLKGFQESGRGTLDNGIK